MRSRHGGEVGEARHPHRLGEFGCHRAGITEDHPRGEVTHLGIEAGGLGSSAVPCDAKRVQDRVGTTTRLCRRVPQDEVDAGVARRAGGARDKHLGANGRHLLARHDVHQSSGLTEHRARLGTRAVNHEPDRVTLGTRPCVGTTRLRVAHDNTSHEHVLSACHCRRHVSRQCEFGANCPNSRDDAGKKARCREHLAPSAYTRAPSQHECSDAARAGEEPEDTGGDHPPVRPCDHRACHHRDHGGGQGTPVMLRHTVASSRSPASTAGPTPDTTSRSSTEVNGPFSSR